MTLPEQGERKPVTRLCNLPIELEEWQASPGEKIFQLLEYFEHLVVVSQEKNLDTPKQVADVVFKKLSRLSAEGIEINTELLRCIDDFSRFWAEYRDIPIEMPVPGRVFLSVKDGFVRLSGVGEFSFKPTPETKELLQGRINVQSATIYRTNERVDLALEVQHWVKIKSAITKPTVGSIRRNPVRKKRSPTRDLNAFFRMLDHHEAMMSNILSQRSSWDRLVGNPVSGGLPSLGKRAR